MGRKRAEGFLRQQGGGSNAQAGDRASAADARWLAGGLLRATPSPLRQPLPPSDPPNPHSPAMSSPPALPDCHPFACAIQSCLSRSSSDSARCQQEIGKLYACCKSLYKALEKRGEPDVDGLRRTVKGGEACPMVVRSLVLAFYTSAHSLADGVLYRARTWPSCPPPSSVGFETQPPHTRHVVRRRR